MTLFEQRGYEPRRILEFLAATAAVIGDLASRSAPDKHLRLLEGAAAVVPRAMALVADRAIAGLEADALLDPLTALGNRRALDRRLFGAGLDDVPLALAVIDIDGLKAINDRDGHPAGDLVLRAFAQCLADNCRAGDEAFRIGGDEFVLLLPGASPEQAEGCLARITGATITSFSYGLAYSVGGDLDLVAVADLRLYAHRRAKPTHGQ